MKHYPRKRFGQNFLQNQAVIEAILKVFNPVQTDNVIEIGPGLGALTKPLLQKLAYLTVIEVDRDLQEILQTWPFKEKLTVVSADALTVDFAKFGQKQRIIGNLPYNISTALVLYLLHYVQYIEDMLFMVQKEVAERLTAAPGSKQYGRLSVITQYFMDVSYEFEVSPEVFYPKPKVDSAIIRLMPHHDKRYEIMLYGPLEQLLAKAFAMRRKTLANNLKSLISAETLRDLGVEPSVRPEEIPVHTYVQLAKYIFM